MKRKSVFTLLLVFCLLLTMIMPTAAIAAKTQYIRNPSGRKVNVRRGPGKGWTIDAQLTPGTAVTVISKEGSWTEIKSPVYGYVMTEYLTDNAPKSTTGKDGTKTTDKIRYIQSANGKKVNARTGPGISGYAVATQLEPGTRVKLLSTKQGWSAINVGGHTVYVMSRYLSSTAPSAKTKTETSTTAPSSSFSAKIYSANGKKVNMRVSPDENAERITQLEPGTTLEVIGTKGSWYKVKYLGTTGYIMKKYVKKSTTK